MKVFLSWSGEYSRDVASLFSDWIPCVLQQVDIFMSTNAIDAGDRWNDVISAALDDIDFGLLFVTDDNKEKPWLLFEAGALAKNVSRSKVIPILIDAKEIDLSKSPLFGFQYSEMTKDGIFGVMRSIYNSLPEPIIDRDTLTKCLEKWWADLEKNFGDLKKPKPVIKKKNLSEGDRIERIEETMSDMLTMLSRMSRNPNQSLHSNRPTTSLFPSKETGRSRLTSKVLAAMKRDELVDYIEICDSYEELEEIQNAIITSDWMASNMKKDFLKIISDKRGQFFLK
ncbi:toll/interleukin-1 receptor domain-containing protein [Hellea sp.]|nr:toll/interleukin-1 receptor domain-containing protein [Hellea sp.]